MEKLISKIQTPEDCDGLIASFSEKISKLEGQKLDHAREIPKLELNMADLDDTLFAIEAEIRAHQIIVSSFEDGVIKNNAINQITKLEYKKYNLKQRQQKFGIGALIGKHQQLRVIDGEIIVLNEDIARVSARKAELESGSDNGLACE